MNVDVVFKGDRLVNVLIVFIVVIVIVGGRIGVMVFDVEDKF